MNVYIPVVPRYLHSRTIPSVIEAGFSVVVVNLETSITYFDAFVGWWHSSTNGFIIVEHDVEILSAAVTETQVNILQEFMDCNCPWCISPYNDVHLLGCSKFVPKEMKINWSVIRDNCIDGWKGLDMAIARSLRNYGYTPHVHRRATIHHHLDNERFRSQTS